MKLRKLTSVVLACTVLSTGFSQVAQAASWIAGGKVETVISTLAGADNFIVVLETGWSGSGCSTFNDNTVPLALIFIPEVGIPDSLNRNFTLNTMALATNRNIAVSGLDDQSCIAYSTHLYKN